MRDRFRQWFSGEREFVKHLNFNQNDVIIYSSDNWDGCLELYSNYLLFVKENNLKIEDKRALVELESCIKKALDRKWNIQDVKEYLITIIESTDKWVNLFYMYDSKQYKDKFIELVNMNNPEKLYADDTNSSYKVKSLYNTRLLSG